MQKYQSPRSSSLASARDWLGRIDRSLNEGVRRFSNSGSNDLHFVCFQDHSEGENSTRGFLAFFTDPASTATPQAQALAMVDALQNIVGNDSPWKFSVSSSEGKNEYSVGFHAESIQPPEAMFTLLEKAEYAEKDGWQEEVIGNTSARTI